MVDELEAMRRAVGKQRSKHALRKKLIGILEDPQWKISPEQRSRLIASTEDKADLLAAIGDLAKDGGEQRLLAAALLVELRDARHQPDWDHGAFKILREACDTEQEASALRNLIDAIAVVGRSVPTEASEVLWSAFAKPSQSVQQRVVAALASLDVVAVPDMPDRLIDVMLNVATHDSVRVECCRALAGSGPDSSRFCRCCCHWHLGGAQSRHPRNAQSRDPRNPSAIKRYYRFRLVKNFGLRW